MHTPYIFGKVCAWQLASAGHLLTAHNFNPGCCHGVATAASVSL
jgi:hypothetical protein